MTKTNYNVFVLDSFIFFYLLDSDLSVCCILTSVSLSRRQELHCRASHMCTHAHTPKEKMNVLSCMFLTVGGFTT